MCISCPVFLIPNQLAPDACGHPGGVAVGADADGEGAAVLPSPTILMDWRHTPFVLVLRHPYFVLVLLPRAPHLGRGHGLVGDRPILIVRPG